MSRLVPSRLVMSRLEIKAFELPFRQMYSISVLFDNFQAKNLAKICLIFFQSRLVSSRLVSTRSRLVCHHCLRVDLSWLSRFVAVNTHDTELSESEVRRSM